MVTKDVKYIREAAKKKKRFFLGDLSQIWVGGAADSQTFGDIYQPLFFSIKVPKCGWVGWLTPKQGPNPSKPPQIAPKIAFFDPNFTFRSPKSHKNPGVGGWVNRFGRDLPKKTGFFFGSFPKEKLCVNDILDIRKCSKADQIMGANKYSC